MGKRYLICVIVCEGKSCVEINLAASPYRQTAGDILSGSSNIIPGVKHPIGLIVLSLLMALPGLAESQPKQCPKLRLIGPDSMLSFKTASAFSSPRTSSIAFIQVSLRV